MDELRKQIVDILGLEVAPNGEPNYLLVRDEYGTVLEGTDYSEEVEELITLYTSCHNAGYQAAMQDGQKREAKLERSIASLKRRIDTLELSLEGRK